MTTRSSASETQAEKDNAMLPEVCSVLLEKTVGIAEPLPVKNPETLIKHFEVEELKNDIVGNSRSNEGENFYESPSLAEVVSEPKISVSENETDNHHVDTTINEKTDEDIRHIPKEALTSQDKDLAGRMASEDDTVLPQANSSQSTDREVIESDAAEFVKVASNVYDSAEVAPDMKPASIEDACKPISVSRNEKKSETPFISGVMNTDHEESKSTADMSTNERKEAITSDAAEKVTLKSLGPTEQYEEAIEIDGHAKHTLGYQSSIKPIKDACLSKIGSDPVDSEAFNSSDPLTNQCYEEVETSIGANEDISTTTRSFSPNEQNEQEETESSKNKQLDIPQIEVVLNKDKKLEEDIDGSSEMRSRDVTELNENIPDTTSERPEVQSTKMSESPLAYEAHAEVEEHRQHQEDETSLPKSETVQITQGEPFNDDNDEIDVSASCQSTETAIGDKEQDEKTVCADHLQEKCTLEEKNISIADRNKEEDGTTQSNDKDLQSHLILVDMSNYEQVCEGATDKVLTSELKASSTEKIQITAGKNSEDKLQQLGEASEERSHGTPNANEKGYEAEETSGLPSLLPVHERKFSDTQPAEDDTGKPGLEKAVTGDHFATPESLKKDVDDLDIFHSTDNENRLAKGGNEFMEEMGIDKKSLEEATETGSENVLVKVTEDAKGTPENYSSSEKVGDDDFHLDPAGKEIIQDELISLKEHVISDTTKSGNKGEVVDDQESTKEKGVAKGLQEEPTADKKLKERHGEQKREYNNEAPKGQKLQGDFDALDCGHKESEVISTTQEVSDNIESEVECEAVTHKSTKDSEMNKDSTTEIGTEKEVAVSADNNTLEESLMNHEKHDNTLSETAHEETEALGGFSLEKNEDNEDEPGVPCPVGTFELDDNIQKEEFKDGGECNDERSKDADEVHSEVVDARELKDDQTSLLQSETIQKNPEEPFHVAPEESNESVSSQEKQRSYVNLPQVVEEKTKAESVDGDDYTQEKQILKSKNISTVDLETSTSLVEETKQEVYEENQSLIIEPKDNAQEEDINLKSTTFVPIDADKVEKESKLDSTEKLQMRAENTSDNISQQHTEPFTEQDHGAPSPIKTAIDGGETTFESSSGQNEGKKEKEVGETSEVQTQQSENEKQFSGVQSVENDQSGEGGAAKTIIEEQSPSSENTKHVDDLANSHSIDKETPPVKENTMLKETSNVESDKSETILDSEMKIHHSEAPHGTNEMRGNESLEGATSETGSERTLEEETNEAKGTVENCISTEKIRNEDCQFDQTEKVIVEELPNTTIHLTSETTEMCKSEEARDQERDEQGIAERLHEDSTIDNMLNRSLGEEEKEHNSADEAQKELNPQEDCSDIRTKVMSTTEQVLSSEVAFLQHKDKRLDDKEYTIEKNSQAQNAIISDPSEVGITNIRQLTDNIESATENEGLLHESTKDSRMNENPSTAVEENQDTILVYGSSAKDSMDHEKPDTTPLEPAYEENEVSRDFAPVKKEYNEKSNGPFKENNIIEKQEEHEKQHSAIEKEAAQDSGATKDELSDKDEEAKEKHEDQATGTITGGETEQGGTENLDVKLENFSELSIRHKTHVDESLDIAKPNDIPAHLIEQNRGFLDEKEKEISEEQQPSESTEIRTLNAGKDAQLPQKDLAVVSSEDNGKQPKIDELKHIDVSEAAESNTNEEAQENNEGRASVAISGSEIKHSKETEKNLNAALEKDPVEGRIMATEFKDDNASTMPDKKIPGQGDPKDLTDTVLLSEDKDIQPVSVTETAEQEIDELKHVNDSEAAGSNTDKEAKEKNEDEASVTIQGADAKHEESEKDAQPLQENLAANNFNAALEKESIEGTETVLSSKDKDIQPVLISNNTEHEIDKLKREDASETTGSNKEEERKDKNEDQATEAASASEIAQDEVDIQRSTVEREDPKNHDASIKLESLSPPEKSSLDNIDESIDPDKPKEIAPDKIELNEISLSMKEMEMEIPQRTPPSKRMEATIASVDKDAELLEKDLELTAVQHEMSRVESGNDANAALEASTVLSEVKGTTEVSRKIEQEPSSIRSAEDLTHGSLDQTHSVVEERKTLDQLSEAHIDDHAKSSTMEITQREELVDPTSNKMEKSEPKISVGGEDIPQTHKVSMTLERELESIEHVHTSETMVEAERVECADNARTEENEKCESSISVAPTMSAPTDLWKQSTKEKTQKGSVCGTIVTQGVEELKAAPSGTSPKHKEEAAVTVYSEYSTGINRDLQIHEEGADETFRTGVEISKCAEPSTEDAKAEEQQKATDEMNKGRRSLTTETNTSTHEEEILEFNEESKVTEKHEEPQIENMERAEDKEMLNSEAKHAKEEGDKQKGEDSGFEVPLVLEKDLPDIPSNEIITEGKSSSVVPEEKLQVQEDTGKSMEAVISEEHRDIQPVSVTESEDTVIKESEHVNASEAAAQENKVECGEQEQPTRDYEEKSESSASLEPAIESSFDLQQASTNETIEKAKDTEPQESDSSHVPPDAKVSSSETITKGSAIDSNITHDKQEAEKATSFASEANPKMNSPFTQVQQEAAVDDFKSAGLDSRFSEVVQEQPKSEKEQMLSDEAKENSLSTEKANSITSLSEEESAEATKKEKVKEITEDLDERSKEIAKNEEPQTVSTERAEDKDMKTVEAKAAEEERQVQQVKNSGPEVPLVVPKDLVDLPSNQIVTEDRKDESSSAVSDEKLQVQEDPGKSSRTVIYSEDRDIITGSVIEEPKRVNQSVTAAEADCEKSGEQQLTSHDHKEKSESSKSMEPDNRYPSALWQPSAKKTMEKAKDTESEELLAIETAPKLSQREAAANEQTASAETKDPKVTCSSTETANGVDSLPEKGSLEARKKEVVDVENAGTAEDEKVKPEEEEEEEEEGDEQREKKSSGEAPVMVEAHRDVEEKVSPKKSHNILSGVGSKVKYSIAKVKKAITGKHSHPKPPSPK